MAEKTIIPISLRGEMASKAGRLGALELGHEGNYGMYQLKLLPNHEWEGLAIKAIWHTREGNVVTIPIQNIVDVPEEAARVDSSEFKGWVTFVGVDGVNQRKVTNRLEYKVEIAGPIDGDEPIQTTPNVVDQILTKVDEAEQQAKKCVDQADKVNEKSENAEPYAKEAKDAAAQAQTGALAAGKYHNAAQTLADEAREDAAATAQLAEDFRTIAATEQKSVQQIGADERHALTLLAEQKSAVLDRQIDQAIASVTAQVQTAEGRADAAGVSAQTAEQHKLDAEAAKIGSETAKFEAETARQIAEQASMAAKAEADRSVSMGIIGAQVGDSVKVKAVDIQGKPTEWEPMEITATDMPATVPVGLPAGTQETVQGALDALDAKDAWKLIESVTTTEDAAFKRTQEPDGTPYHFKKIYFEVAKTGSMRIRIDVYNADGYLVNTMGTERHLMTVYTETYRAFIRTLNCEGNERSKLACYTFTRQTVPMPSGAIVRLESTTTFPAGTKIYIWAVRT